FTVTRDCAVGCSPPNPTFTIFDASPDRVFSASDGGAATSGGAFVGSLALLQATSAIAMHAATIADRTMKRSYDGTRPPTSVESKACNRRSPISRTGQFDTSKRGVGAPRSFSTHFH